MIGGRGPDDPAAGEPDDPTTGGPDDPATGGHDPATGGPGGPGGPSARTDLASDAAPPTTGDDEVDATLRALQRGLDDEDPAAVADALATAHRSLQARLTSPDPDQPGAAGARPRPR
ncbi:hypothetical protein [Serinicoccus chungangensis]|uniref:hypothetical protein n=1 Tax=Serinicoccus chungangensis TaxID=767452 RepID=UPI00128EC771|nr:hypothetical protein [Serinicoccus chungangensis]